MKLSKNFGDFIRVSAANYASRAIGALITVLIARWLGPEKFGIYSIGFYVLVIFGDGLTGFDQTFVHFAVRESAGEREILSTYFFLKFSISIIILMFSISAFLLPVSLNLTEAGNSVVIWGLLGGIGMQLVWAKLSLYQARKDFYHYSKVKLAYYLSLLFLLFLGVQFDVTNLYYYLLIYFIGSVSVFGFRDFNISFSAWSGNLAKNFWGFGRWLILYHLLRMINLRLDFFWLQKYYSGEVLGQYSAALKLVNIFALMIGTFPILLLPKASSIEDLKDLKDYWNENVKICLFLISTWIIIFVFAPFFVRVLYGSEYVEAIVILKVLLFSVLPLIFLLPLKYILFSMEKTFFLFAITAIQFFSLVFLIPLMLQRGGVLGAAYSKIIAYGLTLVLYFIVYKKKKETFLKELRR